jgi:membrane associated rhomboid family serine protease
MLPIGDQNPTRTTPYVTWGLIAANVVAFAAEFWIMANGGQSWVVPGYGLVPARLTNDPLGEGFTVLTSMFLHGSVGHLGGNMLFLYIFGDNVEDALGHVRYIFFYLLAGLSGALAQTLTDPSSHAPMVGASGAIAGVLGAYMLLYPRAPVTVLIPIFWLIVLPAWLVIGVWFLLNVSGAMDSFGSTGGVAFFAHVGGFVAGMLGIYPLLFGRRPPDHTRWTSWRGASVGAGTRFGKDRHELPRAGPGRWDPWR